ncbi:MAG: hypothetical protein ACYTDX_00690 [Planctomycetota bacterium]|jgi:hypothetical protein
MRFGLAATALLAVGAVLATASVTAQDTKTTGERKGNAPEFQAREWIGGDGNFTAQDFKGKVVFLEAWATT